MNRLFSSFPKIVSKSFNSCCRQNSGNSSAFILEARKFLQENKYSDAVLSFEKALQEEPMNASVAANLAIMYQHMQPEKSEEMFTRAVNLGATNDPEFSGHYACFLHEDKNEPQKADEYFQKAISDPNCSSAILHIYGKVLQVAQKFDEAKNCYERSLERPVGNNRLRLLCSYAELMSQNFDGGVAIAEGCLTEALSIDPNDLEAVMQSGKLAFVRPGVEARKAAHAHFIKALELSSGVATPVIAACLRDVLPEEEAHSTFEFLMEQVKLGQSPPIIGYHSYALYQLREHGSPATAAKFFAKCREIGPKDCGILPQMYAQMMLNFCVFCARHLMDFGLANDLLKHAREVAPDLPNDVVAQVQSIISQFEGQQLEMQRIMKEVRTEVTLEEEEEENKKKGGGGGAGAV